MRISNRFCMAIIVACVLGWAMFIALFWVGRDRIFSRISRVFVEQNSSFNDRLNATKERIRQIPWMDERSTVLFLGDSHIEMGRWYDLFNGRYAIQNAGLSQAKVHDVMEIGAAFEGRRFGGVVLMCGINDLGSGADSVECLGDYGLLLDTVCRMTQSAHVRVVSVLPVVAKPLDHEARKINSKVAALNLLIKKACHERGIRYVDLAQRISVDNSLDGAFSLDGLHLNERGYAAMVHCLAEDFGSFPINTGVK